MGTVTGGGVGSTTGGSVGSVTGGIVGSTWLLLLLSDPLLSLPLLSDPLLSEPLLSDPLLSLPLLPDPLELGSPLGSVLGSAEGSAEGAVEVTGSAEPAGAGDPAEEAPWAMWSLPPLQVPGFLSGEYQPQAVS